jgi:DNA repair protein RadC
MPILREIKIRYAFKEVDCEITGQALNEPQRIYEAFNFLKFEPKEKFIVVNLSKADIVFTKVVIDAAKLLSIDVLDHIIIGESDFYSLKQHGDI